MPIPGLIGSAWRRCLCAVADDDDDDVNDAYAAAAAGDALSRVYPTDVLSVSYTCT